jgi:purine-binding chemotaxis protein CheW
MVYILTQEILNKKKENSLIIFEIGWEQFCIETDYIREIIQAGRIRRLPGQLDFIEGIYNFRGDLIHIVNLKKKLKLNEYALYKTKIDELEKKERKEKGFIIVIDVNDTNMGFMVDKVINVVHTSEEEMEQLSPIFQTSIGMEYIKAIIKLNDRPRILLNVNKMFAEIEHLTIKE